MRIMARIEGWFMKPRRPEEKMKERKKNWGACVSLS